MQDFSLEASIVRIDGHGTARLPCKCIPTTTLTQEARWITSPASLGCVQLGGWY